MFQKTTEAVESCLAREFHTACGMFSLQWVKFIGHDRMTVPKPRMTAAEECLVDCAAEGGSFSAVTKHNLYTCAALGAAHVACAAHGETANRSFRRAAVSELGRGETTTQ